MSSKKAKEVNDKACRTPTKDKSGTVLFAQNHYQERRARFPRLMNLKFVLCTSREESADTYICDDYNPVNMRLYTFIR